MLTNFLLGQDTDIALLQEVVNNDLSNIYGYSAHTNKGTETRCTAIFMNEGLPVNNTSKLPSGRWIAGLFEDTLLMNVYGPWGAGKTFTRKLLY